MFSIKQHFINVVNINLKNNTKISESITYVDDWKNSS